MGNVTCSPHSRVVSTRRGCQQPWGVQGSPYLQANKQAHFISWQLADNRRFLGQRHMILLLTEIARARTALFSCLSSPSPKSHKATQKVSDDTYARSELRCRRETTGLGKVNFYEEQ